CLLGVGLRVFHVIGFFFQAEDGIRDFHVTGVQTCALPISVRALQNRDGCTLENECVRLTWNDKGELVRVFDLRHGRDLLAAGAKIGRASCREGGVVSSASVGWEKSRERSSDEKNQVCEVVK